MSADGGIRPAGPGDADAIAAIHNQGISERIATFETRVKDAAGVREAMADWILGVVCERDGEVLGFCKATPYEERSPYYSGVAEVTVYVAREARGQGVGTSLLEGIADAARERGLHKLVAKAFAGNEPSLALFERCGFSVVGTHRRHGELDGRWLDVTVVERSL